MSNGRFNSQIPRPQHLKEEAEKLQKWTLNTEKSLKEKQGKLQQYSDETESHQHQILSLQKQNENLNSEIKQLTQEKAELCEKVDETKLQANILSSQSNKLASQINIIQATQSTVSSAHEVKDNQLHTLFQQFEQLRISKDQKIKEVNDKLQSMDVESNNTAGKAGIKDLEDQLAQIKKELDCKENEKDNLTKELETFAKVLKNKEDEVLQIKFSHKNALETIDITQTEFLASETKLKVTLSTIGDNIEKVSQENIEISKSIENNNSCIDILSTKIKESTAINNELKSELDKKISERMNVQKDIDSIASELSVSNEKMENLKPIIADIDTMNQDIHMLTEDLVSCTEKKVMAEKEVEELKKVQKQKFLLEEENVTLSGRIKVLEDKIEKIVISHQNILEENNSTQKSIVELEVKVKEKELELNDLNTELDIKMTENCAANANKLALQESITQLEAKIKLLQNNLKDTESLIDEKNEQDILICKLSESKTKELQELTKEIEAMNTQFKESINSGENIDIEAQKACSSIEANNVECENLNADILGKEVVIKNKEDEVSNLALKHNSLLLKLTEETKYKDELSLKFDELNEEIVTIEKELEATSLETDDDQTRAIDEDNKKIKQLEKSLKHNEKCIATNKKKDEKILKQIEKVDNLLVDHKCELKLSNEKIKIAESKVTSSNQDISLKKKQLSAVNTKSSKLTKTLNEKTKINSGIQEDIINMEMKLHDVSKALIEQTEHQEAVDSKMDNSLETIGNEHKQAIEELQKEKSDLSNKLDSINQKVNAAKLAKKTKEAQEKQKTEDEIASEKNKLEKAKSELEKSRQAQQEEIKNENLKLNAMRAELEKIKSRAEVGSKGDQLYSSQSNSFKGDYGHSSLSTSRGVRERFDKSIVTPMKAPMRLAKGTTFKSKVAQSITSKFKSTDVYKFGSSSDSEAFSLDLDVGKETPLKSLTRGGLPTPLSVTRVKPSPKTYSRSTPQKKNSAPVPPKQHKPSAKPIEMFSNILSPLSEGSESN